jgi:protein SCO1
VSRRYAAGLAAIAALLLSGCAAGSGSGGSPGAAPTSASASGFRGATFVQPHPRPSFVLTDEHGKRYDFAARTKGKTTFLFFGYTHCPDICPTTMADVAAALRSLPASARDAVQVVFVTTDPKRDTPKALAAWLANFDADLTTKFVGLTGPQSEIDAAQRGAGVQLAEDGGQTHSAQLLLYGPDDVSRVFYLVGSTVDDMAHDLPLVMRG